MGTVEMPGTELAKVLARVDAERRMRFEADQDLSRALELLIEALTTEKPNWRERAWTFVDEMVPGEREYLTGDG